MIATADENGSMVLEGVEAAEVLEALMDAGIVIGDGGPLPISTHGPDVHASMRFVFVQHKQCNDHFAVAKFTEFI